MFIACGSAWRADPRLVQAQVHPPARAGRNSHLGAGGRGARFCGIEKRTRAARGGRARTASACWSDDADAAASPMRASFTLPLTFPRIDRVGTSSVFIKQTRRVNATARASPYLKGPAEASTSSMSGLMSARKAASTNSSDSTVDTGLARLRSLRPSSADAGTTARSDSVGAGGRHCGFRSLFHSAGVRSATDAALSANSSL